MFSIFALRLRSRRRPGWTATLAALSATLSLLLTACGGGGGYGGSGSMPTATPSTVPPPMANTTFNATRLVRDVAGNGATVDQNLVNPWGIAFNPTGFVWVANNGSNTSTLYDGNGVAQSLVVSTPDAPTGIVFNGSATDFMQARGTAAGVSPFIFSTESGVIAAWAPAVDRTHAATMYDGSAAGSVYKGLTIAGYNGATYLYATDFHNGRVDVFNSSFARVSLPGNFSDPGLPANYAPFGIQAIGDRIYVSYAQREATGDDEVHAAGAGEVAVFDTAGMLIRRLVVGGDLNAPWGIALAPSNFGTYSGKLLVANFGDGTIHAYDPSDGTPAGALTAANGAPLFIDGLWGIAFGPGVNSQPANTLFYTAGPGDEAHGAYGRIDMAP